MISLRWLMNLLGDSDDPCASLSSDELQMTALRLIGNERPSACQLGQFAPPELLALDQGILDALRAKYARYPSRRMRREIASWCDYFQREIIRAERLVAEKQHIDEALTKLRSLGRP